MSTFILLILLSTGVSIITGNRCACCFSGSAHQCQTLDIELSCTDCTSFFCANHVKGCQGSPPCEAECQFDSSSTTTPMTSSSSMGPNTPTTSSGEYRLQIGLLVISANLILLILCQLNF